jgi:hypothetical protein
MFCVTVNTGSRALFMGIISSYSKDHSKHVMPSRGKMYGLLMLPRVVDLNFGAR